MMKVSNWEKVGGERHGVVCFSPGRGPSGRVQQAPGRCRSTSVQRLRKAINRQRR